MSRLPSVATVGFLHDVFTGSAFDLRSGSRSFVYENHRMVEYVERRKRPTYGPWTLGSTEIRKVFGITSGNDGRRTTTNIDDAGLSTTSSTAAGWHCSWCLPVEGIQTKLTSAQNGDFPRWGDYPSKLEPAYLEQLTKCGLWFDDSTQLDWIEEAFVPRAIVENAERFGYLLPKADDERRKNISCLRTSTVDKFAVVQFAEKSQQKT
jgi:hypothetical protein